MARSAARGLRLVAALAIGVGGTAGCLPQDSATAAREAPPVAATSDRHHGPRIPPTAPQGLVVDVDGDGMTVSWLAAEGATDGYAVTVDGGWQLVPGTKVHFEEYLPGLPYRVEVAGVAGGERGPAAVAVVDPEQGRRPPVIMSAAPAPGLVPPPDPSSDSVVWPDPAEPAAQPDSGEAEVRLSIDGCGFAPGGAVAVAVSAASDSGAAPAVLLDDANRVYLPESAQPPISSPTPIEAVTRFVPVPSGPPPAEAVIDRVLFLDGAAGQQRGYREQQVAAVRWGFHLCPDPIPRPHW